MSFWRKISPKHAAQDFVHEWSRPNPYRWRVLGVSVAATAGIMIVAIPASERIPPRPPQIVYISTFASGRTEKEIIASNIENQRRKDEIAAREEARAELRKDLYRELGKATFVDVDAMEREIARQEAAEKAAAAKALTEKAGTGPGAAD